MVVLLYTSDNLAGAGHPHQAFVKLWFFLRNGLLAMSILGETMLQCPKAHTRVEYGTKEQTAEPQTAETRSAVFHPPP